MPCSWHAIACTLRMNTLVWQHMTCCLFARWVWKHQRGKLKCTSNRICRRGSRQGPVQGRPPLRQEERRAGSYACLRATPFGNESIFKLSDASALTPTGRTGVTATTLGHPWPSHSANSLGDSSVTGPALQRSPCLRRDVPSLQQRNARLSSEVRSWYRDTAAHVQVRWAFGTNSDSMWLGVWDSLTRY